MSSFRLQNWQLQAGAALDRNHRAWPRIRHRGQFLRRPLGLHHWRHDKISRYCSATAGHYRQDLLRAVRFWRASDRRGHRNSSCRGGGGNWRGRFGFFGRYLVSRVESSRGGHLYVIEFCSAPPEPAGAKRFIELMDPNCAAATTTIARTAQADFGMDSPRLSSSDTARSRPG